MHKKAVLEILFWLLTAALLAIVVLPVYRRLPDYPFLLPNVVFILTFVTLSRYIFLLPHTFLAKNLYLKGAFIFLSIPLTFYLIQEINKFQTFIDEQGFAALVGSLPQNERSAMMRYIRNEMLLFGVGSVVSSVLFPFRLIQSIWLQRNRGRA